MNLRLSLILLAVTVISGGLAWPAAAQDVQHGRVSFTGDAALVKGESDDEWSYATLNSLILPGDTVWADEQESLELEFSSGVFVRLADGSRVDVVQTPPNAHFRGWTGSFYVQRVRRSAGSLVFETPVATVHVSPDSQVRIDILEDGSTTVTVRWGVARVADSAGQEVSVSSGERTYIDPGYLPSAPVAFNREENDAFDAWNRERARLLAVGADSSPVGQVGDAKVPIGTADLNQYGEWVYVDDKYYWRPTVVKEYVPYSKGYWSYVPSQGYVWVGNYPFTYITSHHGYWDYNRRYGWIWSFRYPYSPAYAVGVRYGDVYLWAPCDPFGRPVYYYGYNYHTIGGLNFYFGATSFIFARDLFFCRPIHVHHFHHHHRHHLRHGHDVHHWDFHSRRSRFADNHRFEHRQNLRSRHFEPDRVLRGPSRLRDDGVFAENRIARLKERVPRGGFNADPPLNRSPNIRTADRPGERRANVRDVKLAQRTRDDLVRDVEGVRDRTIRTRDLVARRGTIDRGNFEQPGPGRDRAGDQRRGGPAAGSTGPGRDVGDRLTSRPPADRVQQSRKEPRSSLERGPRPVTTRPGGTATDRPVPNRSRDTAGDLRANPGTRRIPTISNDSGGNDRPAPNTIRNRDLVTRRPVPSSGNDASGKESRPTVIRGTPSAAGNDRSPVRVQSPSGRTSSPPAVTRGAPETRPTPTSTRRPSPYRSSPGVNAPAGRSANPRGTAKITAPTQSRRGNIRTSPPSRPQISTNQVRRPSATLNSPPRPTASRSPSLTSRQPVNVPNTRSIQRAPTPSRISPPSSSRRSAPSTPRFRAPSSSRSVGSPSRSISSGSRSFNSRSSSIGSSRSVRSSGGMRSSGRSGGRGR